MVTTPAPAVAPMGTSGTGGIARLAAEPSCACVDLIVSVAWVALSGMSDSVIVALMIPFDPVVPRWTTLSSARD